MSVNFLGTEGETPASMKFKDGDSNYEIDFAGFAQAASDKELYTAYLVINESAATSRTQEFFIPKDEATAIHTNNDFSDKYEAGCAYVSSTFSVETYTTLVVNMPTEIPDLGSSNPFVWGDNDAISLYSGEALYADCTISSVGESTFTIGDSKIIDNQSQYTAYYPKSKATSATQTQSGDNSASHLKGASLLSAYFAGGDDVTLTHESAFAKITFTAEANQTPSTIEFVENGVTYTLTMSNITADSGEKEYTAYIALPPYATVGDHEWKLNVTYSDTSIDKYSQTVTTTYEAGSIVEVKASEMTQNTTTSISSAAALVAWMDDPTTDAELTQTITIDGETIPSVTNFAKVFDGKSFAIEGLNLSGSTEWLGLFTSIAAAGEVKNLTLTSPKVSGGKGVGSIAGNVLGKVTDCTVTGADIDGSGANVGGVAGQNKGTISGCTFSGSVDGASSVGGIVGILYSEVSGCSVGSKEAMSATTITATTSEAGGIAGKATKTTDDSALTSSIKNSTFNGSLTTPKNGGGIAGLTDATTIDGCTNNGSVSASGTTGFNVGGIAGLAQTVEVTITNCVNNGAVTAPGSVAGGILGLGNIAVTIVGCANESDAEILAGGYKAGGVVASATVGATIVACYNTGSVTATTNTGAGILADVNYDTTVVGCYNAGVVMQAGAASNLPIVKSGALTSGAVTESGCYYINATNYGASKGTNVADIATLNTKVEDMNTAINATAYNTYNYVKGATESEDTPTLE